MARPDSNGRSAYRLGAGTCAGPVVAGVAALTLSVDPELSAPILKRILMDNTTLLADRARRSR